MARFLVLYGTTDGHTARIARTIADALRIQGSEVDVIDAADASPSIWPHDYSGVVIAASVHAGRYQAAVRSWVRAYAPILQERPTAFVSVCLGVLQQDPRVRRDLDLIIDRFVKETGWRPTTTKIVPGALFYTRYNWIKRLVMKRIARKAGGDTDTTRNYVYTDWNDVRRFAEEFGRSVSGDVAGTSVDRSLRRAAAVA
jgi:menaquinone-dependent protoporphyrinogen oxidase